MHRLIALVAATLLFAAEANAQLNTNFAEREAHVINNAGQYVALSDFTFQNAYRDRADRFLTNLKWTNTGDKPITAFEVVMLFYDPFNRQISSPSGRWMITGQDSANWTSLQPGQTKGDGTIGYGSEKAFTGVVYVRAIRFEDGSVWYSNQSEVENKIEALIPNLTEIGPIDPGAKPPPKP